MTNLLMQKAQHAFSVIIDKYKLNLKEIDKYCVVLVGESFAVGVSLDRDGLAYTYYDLSSTCQNCYNLGLFLIQKRRDNLTFENDDKSDKPLDEYLSHNLAVFSGQMESACQDILSGDKQWIKKYSWPSIDVNDEVLAAIKVG